MYLLCFFAGGFNTDVEDYQTLLSLARSQGAVGGQNRGACKICGQLGHLTKQCRNHLSAHFQMPGRADGTAAAANGKPLMPTLPTVGGEDEDLSSDLSDLDSSSSDSDSSSESEGERRKRKVCQVCASSLRVAFLPISAYCNADRGSNVLPLFAPCVKLSHPLHCNVYRVELFWVPCARARARAIWPCPCCVESLMHA